MIDLLSLITCGLVGGSKLSYETRHLGRQQLRYNSANSDIALLGQLVIDDEKVTPTSATIEIFKPGSSTAVLAATAMTVSGTLLLKSGIDTTTVADFPLDTGYRADLAITYNSVVYYRHIVFDVVKYLFIPNVAFDQLVALDDGIRGMQHDGDADFSELIGACRDVLQMRLESKILGSRKLLSSAIIDTSRVSTAFRFLCLHQIWFNKGDADRAGEYKDRYNETLDAVLSSTLFDDDQDGQENSEIGGIQEVRFGT